MIKRPKKRNVFILVFLTLIWAFHFLLLYKTNFNLTRSWLWNFTAYFTPLFLILELLIAIILLLFKRYYLALVPLIVLFLSKNLILDTIQINKEIQVNGTTLKVLNYNVALIPYEKEDSLTEPQAIKELFTLLEQQNPDILCLQEFHNDDDEVNLGILQRLSFDFGYEHYVINPIFSKKIDGYSGPIILSKYPIINDFHLNFKEGKNPINHLVSVDIAYANDTIRLVNVHLKSMTIRLSKQPNIENLKTTYKRLKNGFNAQRSQVEETYDYISKSPYEVVLCGDFNSLPYSYTYQYLKQRMKNTFDARGQGFGFTLNRFPHWARIDNVFVSKKIIVKRHEVLKQYQQSDHFPVMVELEIKKETKPPLN